MTKTAIIDDELSGRRNLRLLIEKHLPELEIVGDADAVSTGKLLIEKHAPELVFLDVELTDGNGFDLLNSLNQVDFELIFVTAYSNYAIKAFQFAALDYILKPIKIDRLISAVERVLKMRGQLQRFQPEQYQIAGQNFNQPLNQENRIALPTLEGFQFVQVKTIVHCRAKESYCEVHFDSGTSLLVSRKLAVLEEMLVPYRFCRIHKSHLINLNHLISYTRGKGGEVHLSNGAILEVARRKKEEFLRSIGTDRRR